MLKASSRRCHSSQPLACCRPVGSVVVCACGERRAAQDSMRGVRGGPRGPARVADSAASQHAGALHLSSSSSTGYKGVVDMGSQRLTLGGRPFKAQATCGHIRPLGYFATRLDEAVCYSRWFDSDRRHEPEARSSSGDSSQREAQPPPRAAARAAAAVEAAAAEAVAAGPVIPSRSAKQRRRVKKRRSEPRDGETTSTNDNNGDKCDDTEDDEDEVSSHQ